MKSFILAGLLAGLALASPLETRQTPAFEKELANILAKVNGGSLSVADASTQMGNLLKNTKPKSSPKTPQQLQDALKLAWGTQNGTRTNIVSGSLYQLEAGASPLDGLENFLPVGSVCPGINCDTNTNPPPRCPIFPRKAAGDAPYDIPEEKLRAAIFIPPGFSYGANGKQPVLLVPGTGSYGGVNFQNNLAKIIAATDYAEAFWLNVPGAMLDDIQNNAQYVAYALNYMQCQSGRTVAVAGWSQASIAAQWALKYWPSTRRDTTDLIAYSGDYHGTVNANLLCAGIPCPPCVLQQEFDSTFIATLRRGLGDSAIVPTTNIYSAFFDEIVQPQIDPFASGSLNIFGFADVSNTALQTACLGQPGAGGSFYEHAVTLISGVGAELLKDALRNRGPGQLSRIDRAAACRNYFAQELEFQDVLFTAGLIPLAGFYLATYPDRSFTERPIKPYAA